MGRLIDADALIEALKNEPSYSIELPANIGDSIQKLLSVHQKMVVDVVKKQPTAYDVEKVVAELEEKLKNLEHNKKLFEDNQANYGIAMCVSEITAFKMAIDIVKAGGAE